MDDMMKSFLVALIPSAVFLLIIFFTTDEMKRTCQEEAEKKCPEMRQCFEKFVESENAKLGIEKNLKGNESKDEKILNISR
jgi:hypothetical protein